MIYFIYFIFLIVGGIMAYILLHRDTNIRFKVTVIDWMMPVMSIFIFISGAIIFETMFNDWIQINLETENVMVWIIDRLLEGGILVPFIAFGLSRLFGKLVINRDLDLNPLYGELTAKLFFTVSILVNCVGFFVYIYNHYAVDGDDTRGLMTRLVIWVISAISIWLPIGNGCSGRADENKVNEKNSKKRIGVKAFIKYYSPILFDLLGISVLFLVDFMEVTPVMKYMEMIRQFMLLWAAGCFVVMYIDLLIESPSKRMSDRLLSRRIRLASSSKAHVSHYRNVKYTIKIVEDQIVVYVSKRNVIYKNNQDEADEIFKEETEKFKIETAYMEIRKFLNNIVENRSKFLRESFKQCRDELQKRLEEEGM